MGLNLGVMSAAVTLDDKDYRSKLSGLESASESTFKKIASLAAGYLSIRAFFGFAQSGVQAFANLETAAWNFSQVFQEIPAEASAAEAEMRKLYKLSETTSKNMLSRAADQLQAFGFSAQKSLELARKAAERGIDLASFKGGSQADAVDAIVSALTGQTERMKRFGVVIHQDSEAFKQLTASIQKNTGATELQARTQAVLQTIIEQTKNAEGDYRKEGSTIAQQQMDIAEATIRAKTALGAFLAEGVSPLMDHWNNLLVGFAETDPAMQRLEIRAVAAAAAFAMLAKFSALAKANAVVSSVAENFTFSGVQAKAEADAVAAAENLKVAAAAKTEAYMEARAQLESVRAAKSQAEAAAVALEYEKNELSKVKSSTASADAIAAAEARVALAKQNSRNADLALSKAQAKLTASRNVARTATIQCAAAEKADAAAKLVNAQATTAFGRAQIVLSRGMTAVKTAANGLAASLGPVGAAMIALSAVYMAFQYISEKNRKELEGQIELAQEQANAAREQAQANEKSRQEDVAQFARLKELAKYERLNNSEKKEAETIIKRLTQIYGNLDVSIDAVTGKIKIGAKAWSDMNDAQKQALGQDLNKQLLASVDLTAAQLNNLRSELGSYWADWGVNQIATSMAQWVMPKEHDRLERTRYTDEQNQLDDAMKLKSVEEQIVALERMRNALIEKGEKENANRVNEVIEGLKKQVELRKQLDQWRDSSKSGVPDKEPVPAPSPQNMEAESKAIRAAQTSLESREWEIKFNAASIDEQIGMLDKKLADVFSRQSGKYGTIDDFKNADRAAMTEQELKDLQEIVELEAKRNQLRKRSVDLFRQESESYGRFLQQREKRLKDSAIERRIKTEEKAGNRAGVDAIINREYEKARDAAKRLQREYEQAVKDAQADKILTEEEKKRIADLRSRMQEAMSDEDRWRERGLSDREDKKEKGNIRNAVGAWSAEMLTALLGGRQTPEEETAKNTKEMVRLAREQLKKKNTW